MGHPAGRDSVYRGCRVVKFRLASRDSVHRNWPFPFAIVFRAGVTTLTFLLLYNSPVRNCARAIAETPVGIGVGHDRDHDIARFHPAGVLQFAA